MTFAASLLWLFCGEDKPNTFCGERVIMGGEVSLFPPYARIPRRIGFAGEDAPERAAAAIAAQEASAIEHSNTSTNIFPVRRLKSARKLPSDGLE
jgi:hypothetical protein